MKDFISMQNDKIQKNCKIKVPDDNHPFAIHISKDHQLKEMSPYISRRQAFSEDRTVPRVCVADSLYGCMVGYAGIYGDYQYYHPMPKMNSRDNSGVIFRGGWYIYAIDYQEALKPNKSLVYDASDTGEYWLVNYQKDQKPYHPVNIGKFFIESHTRRYRDKQGTETTYVFYIKVDKDIFFDKNTPLHAGCYKLTQVFLTTGKPEYNDKVKSYEYSIEKVAEEIFEDTRKITCSMLDYQNPSRVW